MQTKFLVGASALALAVGGTGAAVEAKGPPPKRATIKAVQKVKVKINRYIQDGLRWQKDTYQVRTGGTLHIVNNAPDAGPHTFSVVAKKDLPKTPAQILGKCTICEQIAVEHGVDPSSQSEEPPPNLFVNDGTGQSTPPDVDKPGDSAFIAPEKGFTVDLPVKAKAGTTLYFLCAIHPWMQGKVNVLK